MKGDEFMNSKELLLDKWKKRKVLNITNIKVMKIVKIAVGSTVSILIADLLGLKFSASAGVITLLSIQDTKKETFIIAGKRLLAFLMALLIAFVLFESFGYSAFTFGGFLLLFVSGTYLFELQDGLSMSAVLITHFLIEKNMELSFIGNEILIFSIGTIIALLFNLYIPKNEDAVKEDMRILEDKMKEILRIMGRCIISEKDIPDSIDGNNLPINKKCYPECSLDELIQSTDKHINEALTKAYENMNNTLLTDTRYYIQYFEMRKLQCSILKRIKEQLCMLTSVPKQAMPISDFINRTADSFHEYNNGEALLIELSAINQKFKVEPNPENREEFENRAILFLLLSQLESFLLVKKNFTLNISQKQIERFWDDK